MRTLGRPIAGILTSAAYLWLINVGTWEQTAWAVQNAAAGPLREARKLYLTGHYARAAEIYQQEQADSPQEASIGLARCWVTVGKIEPARELLVEASAAAPQSVALLAERAHVAWHGGDHASARTLVDEALELDSHHILARYVQSQLLKAQGDYEGATRTYRILLDIYNQTDEFSSPDDLLWIGLAAADYARWNHLPEQFKLLVNELFPAATQLDDDYWPAHLEMGRLFLEKHNEAEAARSLAAAHRINPSSPDVLAARALLALQQFDMDQARLLIDRSKGIRPRHVPTLRAEADMHFALFDPRKALEVLLEAESVDGRDEATLGRLAAAYALRDAEFDAAAHPEQQRIVERVTQYNPRAGDFYSAMAGPLDQCRQYSAARDALQTAIELMPQLVGPRGQLGLIQMRLGAEEEAQETLEQAYEEDPFDVRVRNTLEVLDVLATYETLETEHFLIRFDPKYDRALARCAGEYLEAIYPELASRLNYAPPQKTLFEFFNNAKNTKGHGWFSARMVGLPQIHTIGACAGQMVALTSPTSMPEQRFHWARVLRHEFVHVINLQQTKFNIPHWFTEALAVRLEDLPRPAEWDVVLARRVGMGRVFNLDDINLGFIRPQSSDDWTLAYCQAELYADHLVERFGEAVLAEMLDAYREGIDTPSAIEQCTGVSVEDFEASYTEFLRDLVGDLVTTGAARTERSFVELRLGHQADPNDFDTAAELAQALFHRKQYSEARQIAENVLANQSKHPLASYVLARLQLVTGQHAAAERLLTESIDEADPQPEAIKLLASLRLQANDAQEAVRLLELGARHQPRDITWIKTLAAIALRQNDPSRLTRYLEQLAAADGDDVLIRKKLALLAMERKDWEQAAHWATESIYIDVLDSSMHKVRATALENLGRDEDAIAARAILEELSP